MNILLVDFLLHEFADSSAEIWLAIAKLLFMLFPVLHHVLCEVDVEALRHTRLPILQHSSEVSGPGY